MQCNHDNQPPGITQTRAGALVYRPARGAAHDLAWRLADTIKHALPAPAHHRIYVELGCRHYRRAAAQALQAAVDGGISIPTTLADNLTEWLRGYHGHTDQPRLTNLLARTKRHSGQETAVPVVRKSSVHSGGLVAPTSPP